MNDIVTQLFFEIDGRIRQHLDDYLGTPFTINQINLNAMRQGQINASDTEQMAQYFWQQGQVFKGFGSMGFSRDTGELAAANEPERYIVVTSLSPNGTVLRRYAVGDDGRPIDNILREVQNFSVHSREWYQTAVKAKKPVWTDINPALTGRRLDVTAVTPYYDQEDRLQGVFYFDISLARINQFLRDINISRSGQIFIIEPNGFIVASSTSEQPYLIKGNEIERLRASSSSEQLIAFAARHVEEQFPDLGKISGSRQSMFDIRGERYFLQITPYHDARGLDWYVVLSVPESDFMSQISTNYRNTLFLILASILISIIAATLVARRVTGPLSSFSQSAKAIAQGDWDQKLDIKRGDEVGDMADAFNTMAVRLRENLASLRESEERFRTLVEQAPEAILVRDADTGLFVDANRNAEKLFGCSREEIRKSGPERFYPPSQPDNRPVSESMREYTARALAGETVTFERIVQNTAGRKIICQVWLTRLPSRDRRLIRGSFIDITEHKRTVERLTKLNECFLGFGAEPIENINHLTALCGELMGATCALYNRLDRGMLCSWGQWNAPPGYNPVDKPEGHICYDTINRGSNEVLVVRNLPETEYSSTDPNVIAYNLKTYVGMAVRLGNDYVGSLCVVYQNDVSPCEDDKMFMGVVASAIAVEERRKRAEEQIELLKHSIDIHYDGAYWMDTDNKFVYVNDAGCRALGYRREELIGMSVSDVNLKATSERMKSVWEKLRKEGFFSAESMHRRRDGSEFPVEIMSTYVQFGGKEYNCGFARDITERKRAEKNLRESEARYRTLFEQAGDYVMVLEMGTDNMLSIADMNEAALRAHGYSREEILGQPISFIDPEASPEKIGERKSRGGPGISLLLNVRHRRKDGTLFDVEANTQMVQIGGKHLIISVERDITERKRAEEQVMASLKEKEVLLREIHHRVKNNMQIISSLLRLQAENIKDENYLGVFKDSYNRIKTMSLVHEKLYQSKDFTNINFKDYINDLVNSICQSHFIDKDIISLNMQIEDVYLGIDTAIPCGLVINELVTNSLKYAFPDGRKGEIRINLRRNDSKGFELIVADNGISIPENIDFRNTDTLGLRLVSILVEDQLLGEVNMDRSRGTEFRIKFRG